MAISTNGTIITRLAGALYGEYLSNASYVELSTTAPATVAANFLSNDFASKTDLQIADTMLTNLGLTEIAGLNNWLAAQLTAAGSSSAAKGAKIVSILNDYAGMSADATYGTYATSFNAKTAASLLMSQTAGKTGGAFGSADTVVVANQTFNLTTGTNTFTGSTGDDTFDAGLSTGSLQTLNSGDRLAGGTGTDELYAVLNSSVTPALVTGIENVTATVSGAATLDLSNATGVSSVVLAGATAAAVVSGISASVGVTLRDSALGHTVTYTGVTGTADSATINVSNLSQTTGVVTSVLGIETLTLNATSSDTGTLATAATTGIGTLTSTQTTSLIVTGDKILNVVDNLGATVLTVDASANTGGVNLDFDGTNMSVTGGAGNDNLSFEAAGVVTVAGGAGNDTFIFDATGTFTTADTVNGGDGTDTLSATSATLVTASAATPTTYRVTDVERITANTAVAAGATIDLTNISTTAVRMTLSAANAGAATFNFNAGASTLVNTAATVGAITVDAAGTATTDSLTISNAGASAVDSLNAQALTATDFETVTINSTGTGAAGVQSVGAISITASVGGTPSLIITGSNQLTTGVVTAAAGSIDASGMTASTTGLDMVTGQNSAITITGSPVDDDLWGAITTAVSQTISGGAGNDSITAGSGNDSISGGDGNDVITAGAGNDYIDAGAGNDTVTIAADANLTSADTIIGGDGTDILSFTADMTDDASTFSMFSGFETFRHSIADTLTMSNFINNQTFKTVQLAGAVAVVLNNVGSTVTAAAIRDGAGGGTLTIDRLVDNTSNAITVSVSASAGTEAATLVLQDEESITFSAATGDQLTVTALTSTDATTIAMTGAGAVISAAAVTSGTKIATVDASASTGAVTFSAANSAVVVTATAGTGVFTFTGGLLADVITGGNSADVLAGGNGADTISGGVGADGITGGAGGDSMTGGSGVDTYTQTLTSSVAATATSFAGANLAAGDTLTFANGVDVITDFTYGATGDVLENGAAVVTAIATGIGQAVATGFATAATSYFVSGSWISASKQFIALADGTGADTMIVLGDATPTALTAAASIVILVGIDSDNLVAANFS